MQRRSFIKQSVLWTAGCALGSRMPLWAAPNIAGENAAGTLRSGDLYKLFRDPQPIYRPFVRWWWNGDKVEADELRRELHVLKEAGIGGVEINPIKFPRNDTDDLGKKSLLWLSDEWIDMLQVAFDEAKSLDMTCDLIVGSGWPFGAEILTGDERADIVVNYSEKLTGPIDYEVSRDGMCCAADPNISSPFPGRKMELLSLQLVPEPFGSLDQAIDLMDKEVDGTFKFKVPEGKYVLFALVKIRGFLEVINGAPGANGPVLNHFNKKAVEKYLNNMSDKIQNRIGPLSEDIRSLFTDSMELEGSNWSYDFADEFKKRRGYDVRPYMSFILFKTGSMGNVLTYEPKVEFTPELNDTIQRVRYDFEYTKAELLDERFTRTYLDWCKKLNVKSRAQAYGRGLFPLESSLDYDIPECESWTMTWLRHRLGEEMSEEDYRRGRAYTMVNKYVSSAAHLRGNRLVSCEEMTNTYTVFNMTLELLKIGGDQTAISGVTHSIFHGFNYSPKEAPFPGWIKFGEYFNENNTMWPYYKYWMETNVPYKTLVWEAINKNGSGCDYVSESIIRDAEMKDGCLCYGPRRYKTLFMIEVESMEPATARKLYDFVACGGRIFCVETYPHKSVGLMNHVEHDKEVQTWVDKMKQMSDRFILLHKPEKDFVGWYQRVQKEYGLTPYMTIEKPDPYLMQNRYQGDNKEEMFFFSYAHRYNSHQTRIRFSNEIVKGRQGWVWDLETGERYRLPLDKDNGYLFDFGPADSLLIVFDKQKRGNEYRPLPASGMNQKDWSTGWEVEFRHSREDTVQKAHFEKLQDLKDTDYVNFCGTAIYRKKIQVSSPEGMTLNLGLVHGVSEVFVNGQNCGVKWYGRRIHPIAAQLKQGENLIEIHVVTVMGNYMKTLKDNKIAQAWTRRQDIQPMGLVGPVTTYTVKSEK